MKISVIITTYNRPQALYLVLKALSKQKSSVCFEVIIADDGSTDATKQVVNKMQQQAPYKLSHVRHEDQGFRAASIRNQAVVAAKGDYLIFMDDDSVPTTSFIKNHNRLAEQGFFVPGNRVLLNEAFTNGVLQNDTPIYNFGLIKWLFARIKGSCNRILPFFTIPLGWLRGINRHSWKGVKTCNLGVWKKDFIAINGFNEDYHGWGYEDSDLVVRLLNNSIFRKAGRYSIPIMHLWHKKNDYSHQKDNFANLQQTITNKIVKARLGVDQYF